MTKIIECDRCKTHTETGYTLYYMVKDWNDDLGRMTFQDYKNSLHEFHLCLECKEGFYEHGFLDMLINKK